MGLRTNKNSQRGSEHNVSESEFTQVGIRKKVWHEQRSWDNWNGMTGLSCWSTESEGGSLLAFLGLWTLSWGPWAGEIQRQMEPRTHCWAKRRSSPRGGASLTVHYSGAIFLFSSGLSVFLIYHLYWHITHIYYNSLISSTPFFGFYYITWFIPP